MKERKKQEKERIKFLFLAMFPQGFMGKNLQEILESLYRVVYGVLCPHKCRNLLFTVSKGVTGCFFLSSPIHSVCDK